MPILENQKIAFIHIPKTAGTSMEKALGVYNKREAFFGPTFTDRGYKQHWTYSELMNVYDLNEYFTFSFVRHPFDRIVSEYFYLKDMGDSFVVDKTFKQFALGAPYERDLGRIHIWQHTRPQVDFIQYEGRLAIDYLGKFETLEQDWKNLQRFVNLPDLKSHSKKIERKSYEYYLDDEIIFHLTNAYKEDLYLYKYNV